MNIYAIDGKTRKTHNEKMKNMFVGGMYLEGKLQEMNGFDLFAIKCKYVDELKAKGSGIQDVTVIMKDGTKVDARFYHWTIYNGTRLKGLVVMPDDTDSMEYVLDMFNSKSEFI